MGNYHGDFIWYELRTPDADAARAFYEAVVGWRIEPQPSGPIDYRMITASQGNVAGLLPLSPEMTGAGARPCWVSYILVDDVDRMVESIEADGGAVHVPATTLEGVGRMARVADPQGAPFYVMKPSPPPGVENPESFAFSYDRPRMGHCAWNELSTSDPDGAKRFYGKHFGWVKDGEMDMGPLGKYEFLRHAGRAPDGAPMGHGVLGAVMPKMPAMPVSAWTFYFRVSDIDAAAGSITAGGGTVIQEPVEIPGGDFSLVGADPQGASFGLVGPRKGAA